MRGRSLLGLGALLGATGLLTTGISGAGGAAGAAVAAGAAGQVFTGGPSVLSAADVARLSADATQHSIIIFRDQLSGLPASGATASARVTAADDAQQGVLAELRQVHASDLASFHVVDAVAATISPAEASLLAANPAVSAVVPDAEWHFAPLDSGPGPVFPASAQQGQGSQAGGQARQICPANPADPLVEPEARQAMNADAADQVVDGSGVKIGIIADGIDPDNPDLVRPDGQHVIFDYQDFSGSAPGAPTDGREAFLDAGTIASQGNQTYDLAGFVNPAHPLPAGCTIKIEGIAPGSSLAVLNVAGGSGGFFESQVIAAIEWAVLHDHVNVLNESFDGDPVSNTQDDPVALADQAAAAAGVTVVTSSGDAGPSNDIGSPATTPGVIAVGATTTYQVYRQTTADGTNLVPGGWEDDNISALSSGGVTEVSPHTVDVVAPGDRGWSLCSSDTAEFQGCADSDHGTDPPPIWAAGGTSASAPETSATAALVIEAYAKTHGGRLPSPALVKQVIVSTATDLDAPADHQGAGLVNTLKAVQLAESVGTVSPQGSTLLVNPTSLEATVTAGQAATLSVRVTNEGAGSQTVTPTVSGRPAQVSADAGTVQLSQGDPVYVDGGGNEDFYAPPQTFTVPPGTDNLDGDITWHVLTEGGAVYETLFDPLGQVAAYSVIDSNQSGYGHVEVHNPIPGTWTAVIFCTSTARSFGPVQFSYTTEDFQQAGTVSPASRTLAPGQSGTFHVTVQAGQAGDEALKLHLGTGGTTDGSIPVVLRALVPVTADGGSFTGTLTGGGASFNAGQELTYQFRVPKGESSLNLGIRVADSDYGLEGFLVDPDGEPLDAQSTQNDNLAAGPAMQFFHGAPAPGRWTLVLLVALPVDGVNLSAPFTGSIAFTGPPVTSSGIPDSRHTVLPAGQPVTTTITVTNTGGIAKDFFADPRLDGKAELELLGSGTNDVALPLSAESEPWWPVPTNTSRLQVAAEATVPVTMDVSWISGDPDVPARSFGNDAFASLTAPEIAPGLFLGLPAATGPFAAAPAGSVNMAAVATTSPFDPAVTASTGDVWAETVDPSVPYAPMTLAPGQTGTITLTFAPAAPKGTTVRGFIGVDTFNSYTVAGDELVNIPYTYTVG